MKKIKKVLAVFLSLLTIMSIFSINVSAEFVGVPGGIGSADPANGEQFTISKGGSSFSDDYYVVGYRFSIVDPMGNTLESAGKLRIVDLIRFKNSHGGSYWGSESWHTNVLALNGPMLVTKRNKFQWNRMYRNGGTPNTDTAGRGSAGGDTFGTFYATTSYVTTNGKPQATSSNSKIFNNLLGYTDTIEGWTTNNKNRAQLLKVLGYSGANETNVKEVLGHNRIVIEPLYRVKWDGTYTLFSATDLAVMDAAYNVKYGPSNISYYSNREFQQALWADENLRMPGVQPLNVVSKLKGDGQRWSYDEILKNTLGMAFYYDTPTTKINVWVKYKIADSGITCTQDTSKGFNHNGENFVTQNGKVFQQVWHPHTDGNLNHPNTFGLSVLGGYKWNKVNGAPSWKMYSFNSNKSITYWYRQSEAEVVDTESLWGRNFWSANVTSSNGINPGEGWRYDGTPKLRKPLKDYTEDVAIWAYPFPTERWIRVIT